MASMEVDCKLKKMAFSKQTTSKGPHNENAASLRRLPHSVDSRFGLYHVAVVLSFLRSPALQTFEPFLKSFLLILDSLFFPNICSRCCKSNFML